MSDAAASPAARARRRAPRRWIVTAGAVLLVGAGLFAIAVLEGDLPADVISVRLFARDVLRHYGAFGSLALLYVEESGIPLPVPGDVYVAYLGHLSHGEWLRWVGALLAIVAVVVAGSSNLYLAARRWGTRIVQHRLAAMVDLDAERVRAAERWFTRWGPIAIILGRHVPGLRIPITVVAGVSGVRYPVFAACVAVSTAGWASVWLYLGARYGLAIGRFFGHNSWAYAGGVILIVAVVAAFLVRGWLRMRAGERRRRRPEAGP